MFTHEQIEKNVGLLTILITLFISVGGLLEIVPLFFQHTTTEPVEGLKPYGAVELVGRDVYIREGCYLCHSQMIRPFRAEVERYGPYSKAGEFVYDHPFQWGSKRTGPDLHRVGGRYTNAWHEKHLTDPRDVVQDSNMPSYAWMADVKAMDTVGADVETKMDRLRLVGVPYTDEQISKAKAEIGDKSEMEVLIAYLQGLGTAVKNIKTD